MARPKQGYFLEDGTRVVGVTTPISRFKDSGALIHWAWDLGMKGINYREARDSAASIGTLGHDLIEQRIHGVEPCCPDGTEPEMCGKALQALASFDEWAKRSSLEIVETELSLVSEFHRYGGTIDAIARVAGKLTVLDLKTSARVYPDNILQVAAYARLWNEHNGREEIFCADVLRVSKETGDFAHHHFGPDTLELGFIQFRNFLTAYETDKRIKKLV
jgi:hypothetical protein